MRSSFVEQLLPLPIGAAHNVSAFHTQHVEDQVRHADIPPAVEHPLAQQREVREALAEGDKLTRRV